MPPSAEEMVLARLREALPEPYRLYPTVPWIDRVGPDAPARDGETDLLIVHPGHGLGRVVGPSDSSATVFGAPAGCYSPRHSQLRGVACLSR
jgi:hypothetical protein